MTNLKSQISNLKSLLFILLIFTALTLYYSIILPLGEADDETDHYQYLRFVAQTGHPPLTEHERNQAGFKGGLAPLYYWLTTWPVALVGEETLPDIRRVDARPERYIPTDGLGINHVLHTLDEQWPWRGQALAWHLVRFLSLPLAWVTIVATYLLGRRLYPEPEIIAIGAAVFVAFLPRFVSSSAVINDDNLVFALTTLLLLVQVIILQNTFASARLLALFGALFGLTLITKYFALILIPEIIFTLIMSQIARRPKTEDQRPETGNPRTTYHVPRATSYALHPLFAFLTSLALTAGPWFAFIMLRFNRVSELGLIPGLAASLGEPQITEGLVGLLSGHSVRPVAATYTLVEWFWLLYRSFWFEYGWMQLFAPNWIYILFTLFLLFALSAHLLHFTHHAPRTSTKPPLGTPHASRLTSHPSPIKFLLTLHFALFLIVVLARYILSATIDTGQGRHLYPALAVIALFISLGLYNFGFQIVPIIPGRPPAPRHLSSIFYLLFTLFFLSPAFILHPSTFILPYYDILPITITSPADLPITYRQNLPLADGLSLAGFDVPPSVSAGNTLPVTLYWRAERETQQDFLLSLCLQNRDNQPVACWHGHFAGGRYPARAWESGDTLADTIFIPIPTCYRIFDQTYHLRLEIWPQALDSAEAAPGGSPLLQETFAEPGIAIEASDALLTDQPQTLEVWHGNQRLTGPTQVSLNESLTWLAYTTAAQGQPPHFIRQATGASDIWSPVPEFNTPLFLPCDDGPTPFAQVSSFIAGPTLPPGPYLLNNPDIPPDLTLSLNLRWRTFAPISPTLVFSPSLAPLSLQFLDQPPLNLTLADWQDGKLEEFANLPALQPANSPILPVTIRWQTRRWMADPLIVSLKLLDQDFNVAGERLATLGDRYPNVLWAPKEVVEETYPLHLRADAPPGLYRLELSLLRQDKNLPNGYEYLSLTSGETILGHNLYPATLRLLDPADGSPPPHPFSAQLGDAIHLRGYDLSQLSIVNSQWSIVNPQSPISLVLYWQSGAKIPANYTVFTQLLGPDGQVWAQWDNPPQAGRYPTNAWTDQDSVVDRYSLTLHDNSPSGQYRLLVGMYDPTTGQRLRATINGQSQPDNAIELTTITINH